MGRPAPGPSAERSPSQLDRLDEPEHHEQRDPGDLDRHSAEEVLGLLQLLNKEHGKTIIMVTHDPKAAEYATHTIHLDKGELADTPAAH